MSATYGPRRPALGWMQGRDAAPKMREAAERLSSGTNIGRFWNNCKSERRCRMRPYERLLTNPVLRADYRITVPRHERSIAAPKRIRPEVKVQGVRNQ